MIKVAICDDDVATTRRTERMLCDIAKGKFIQIDTEVFWKGKHLAEALENDACFDIIFLDIEIEDGITVARRIRETDRNALIQPQEPAQKLYMGRFQRFHENEATGDT